MAIKSSKSEKAFDMAVLLVLSSAIIVTLYPFIHILAASMSDSKLLMQHRGLLFWPRGFNLFAYKKVFENGDLLSGYGNTLLVLFVGTAVSLLVTTLAAYPLSRPNLKYRNAVMFLITFTMLFQGGLIPDYLLINNLGLYNSRFALFLPVIVNTMNLIIMRTSFQGIPSALIESASIDGANDFTILFKIIIPLSMPVVAVMILYYGVYYWNSWFHAMIYLRKRQLFPLQLILREILIINSTDSMTVDISLDDQQAVGESIKYATIVVATAPILLVYPFLQKYFVKGVMVGSIKG